MKLPWSSIRRELVLQRDWSSLNAELLGDLELIFDHFPT